MPTEIQYIMADLTYESAYWRGVIAGVGRYCSEHTDLRLRLPHAEWGLIGDNESIAGSIAIVDGDSRYKYVRRFGKPVVNISSITWPVALPTVTIDNVAVGRMAADHLVNQGYRFFACHTETRVYFASQRLKGFRDRLSELKREVLLFDTGAADRINTTSAVIHRETVTWLKSLPTPVGLFCHNDNRASMLIDLCRESGYRVPDQIGVLGMDNDEVLTSACVPPLSSIDPGGDLVGYRAAAMLMGLIRGEPEPTEPVLIKPRKLVLRASTQPVFTDDEMLAMAIAYIRQHATEPITIDDVLDVVPLSRRSLERRFRERLGRTPGSEIRRVQIDKARQLLADSDQTLNTIARACGYSSFRNFATAFRRETSFGPSAYRKSLRMR
jgi:LacI family transcriptional regulator